MTAGARASALESGRLPDLDAFRACYSAFLREDRVLLTGHSHQAWPDCVREALGRSFDDAARWVDDKWARAVTPLVERVKSRVAVRMGFSPSDDLAFGRSSHELTSRLLSCLPRSTSSSPALRIVTTTGEFHSLWRQLTRLEEEGVEVEWVEATPRSGLAERLLAALERPCALLALSSVLFEDAYVVPRLTDIASRASADGALVLIDGYHAYNVVPVEGLVGIENLFATAGGYKYAQFGEGICWLRVPPGCELRPVDTGWFSDFESLDGPRRAPVRYGAGAARFAGSTFDPAPFYRADAVLDHFDRFGLDVAALRAISLRQTRRVLSQLDAADLPAVGATVATPRDPERRGGFVAIRTPRAREIALALRERGVFVDARRDLLRIGPAPYSTDEEIERGVERVVEALQSGAR